MPLIPSLIFPTGLAGLMIVSTCAGVYAANGVGGSACVVAKQQGNSLAIEWSTGQRSVSQAIEKGKKKLRDKGYNYVFPQANSNAPHGWLVIIKTSYTLKNGRKRESYGCGFHTASTDLAEQAAITDLQSYSWGWTPQYGYELIETLNY